MFSVKIGSIVSVLLFSLTTTALAASPTPTVSVKVSPIVSISPSPSSSTLAPSVTPTAEVTELPLIKPTFIKTSSSPLVWLRFRRFFTFNKIKKSELTLSIANALIDQADQQERSGDTNKASQTLDRFASESKTLQDLADIISSQTTNKDVLAFLDTFLSDRVSQLTLLESLKPEAAAELAKKLTNIRAEGLRDIVKILEKPNLSDAEQQKKLDEIMNKYAQAVSKVDQKLERKLTLKQELDNETEDTELEDKLAEKEDELVAKAAETFDDNELTSLAKEFQKKSDNQGLVVLQKLLDQVPNSAKAGIETAIDAIVAAKVASLRQNPAELNSFLSDYSGSELVQEKILERIKEQSSDESLKQAVEKVKEARKKEIEKAKEKKENKGEQKSPEPKASETPKTEATISPKATSSSEAVQTEKTFLTLKMKDTNQWDKTTYSVKKGNLLTIVVENETSSAITVTLSNGQSAGPVSKDQKASFDPFTINSATTFTANGLSGTISVE